MQGMTTSRGAHIMPCFYVDEHLVYSGGQHMVLRCKRAESQLANNVWRIEVAVAVTEVWATEKMRQASWLEIY